MKIILKNSIYNGLGLVAPTAIALPSIGYFARFLDPSDFGIFILLLSTITFATLFDFGLSRVGARLVASSPKSDESNLAIINTCALLSGMITIVIVVIGVLLSSNIAKFIDPIGKTQDLSVAIEIAMCSFIPVVISNCYLAYYEGVSNFKTLNILRATSSSIAYVVPVLFLYFGETLRSALVGMCISRYLFFVLLLIYLIRSNEKFSFLIKFDIWRELMKEGFPIAGSAGASLFMVSLDKVIAISLKGPSIGGVYSAIADMLSKVAVLPGAFIKALFPVFVSDASLMQQDTRFISFLLILSLCVYLPIIMLAEEILHIWLGDFYSITGGEILKIMCIGAFFNAIAGYPYSRLQSLGLNKFALTSHTLQALIFFPLFILATNLYGIFGSAIIYSARSILDSVGLWIRYYLELKMVMRKQLGFNYYAN